MLRYARSTALMCSLDVQVLYRLAVRGWWWFVVDSRNGKLNQGADVARIPGPIASKTTAAGPMVVVIRFSFRGSRQLAETAWYRTLLPRSDHGHPD